MPPPLGFPPLFTFPRLVLIGGGSVKVLLKGKSPVGSVDVTGTEDGVKEPDDDLVPVPVVDGEDVAVDMGVAVEKIYEGIIAV